MFNGDGAFLRAEHLAFVLLQLGRRVALARGERLAALVVRRGHRDRPLRNLDDEAEGRDMLHLELGDARARLFARLVLGEPAVPFRRDRPQLVELPIVTGRDEAAVRQHHGRFVGDGSVDEVDEGGLGDER